MKPQAYDVSDGPAHPKFALTQFTVDEFHSFWPGIEAMLDSVPHTWRHWTKEYIVACVENSILTVWGIGPPPKAVLIFFTSIHIYPTGRTFSVDWCGGHFERQMLPLIEATWMQYAQLQECNAVEIRGRAGWEPHLRTIGFSRDSVIWQRQLCDIRKH